MYAYKFTEVAFQKLSKFPKTIQQRIVKKLDYFCQQTNLTRFAERLINTHIGEYRFRVGEYRIVFDLENNTLIILNIGHRKDIYRKS